MQTLNKKSPLTPLFQRGETRLNLILIDWNKFPLCKRGMKGDFIINKDNLR
jgi:hypothetical protein